ncbi:MAG: flagellar hook-associated protein FlgK [Verrucomicrobia bacterium]|jgi:flagellar hook-associated protein 1|nr:flagellar hook-associated protein FlgK [Verrucomicrobiota bacterium]
MLGLFGALSLGTRALAAQRQGVEVAGHNLANVNNSAYARQRVSIQSTASSDGFTDPVGSGAEVVAIRQIRDQILDGQVIAEGGVSGSLEAQQRALKTAQSLLGQSIDRGNTGAGGTSAADGVGGGQQLAAGLTDFFNSFASLAAQPASMPEREITLRRAAALAAQFPALDNRLSTLSTQLDESLDTDLKSANALLSDIARLNGQISRTEAVSGGSANDLRDQRQAKLESLSGVIGFDSIESSDGSVGIVVGGVSLVTSDVREKTLETFTNSDGDRMIRASGTTDALVITSGRVHGTLDARDGGLKNLRSGINDLAKSLIDEVNALHTAGFALDGSTGRAFFLGSSAADIRVNQALLDNPSSLQVSGSATARGDNRVAKALSQLGNQPIAALDSQTLGNAYNRIVGRLGEDLSSVNQQLADQKVVAELLKGQRDSVSGVSIDEEMSDLTRFQRGYQASAKLINTIDEMMDTTLSLKR